MCPLSALITHHHSFETFCSVPSQRPFWFCSWSLMQQLSLDCLPSVPSVAEVNMWFLLLNRVSLDSVMGTTSGPPPPSLLSSAALCYLQASWSSSQMAWCCPCIVPTTKSLVRFIWCVALSFLIADTSDMSLVTAQALRDAKVWISQTKHTGPLCVHCHGRSCRAVPTISLPKGCCHCKGHTTDFMGEGSSSPS